MLNTIHTSRAGVLWVVTLCTLALAACGTEASVRAESGEVDLASGASASLAADSLAARADSLVRVGRPWRATTLLASHLTNPTSASDEVRMAGARAAAAWDGWSEVDRVLRGAPWLDTKFGGEGRELLVRSSLERNADALGDARAALADARDPASRVVRRVLLARAFDRAKQDDSASAAYLDGANKLPRIADWLRLRAAGVTRDSAARARLLARVTSAPARTRVALTDAQARERGGDLAGAARAFRRAGAEGSAFRVEALAAHDDASRTALAHRVAAYAGASTNAPETRQALEVLDSLRVPLARDDELLASRAAVRVGLNARAVRGFERARAAENGTLASADLFAYAGALSKVGRNADASRVYASLASDPAYAANASYQRARTMLASGDGAGARAALRDVATRFTASRDAAASALLLLADLQVDDADYAGAETSLGAIGAKYPTSSQAPLARFRLGLLQFGAQPATAALTFDSLAARYPSDDDAIAARYWAGRAYSAAGKNELATERWRTVLREAPVSYYGFASATRLKAPSWTAPTGADSAAHSASVDSAVTRIRELRQLGMDVEARFEVDALAERQGLGAATVADALLAVDEPARAVRVALAGLEHGDSSRAVFRAAFPLLHQDALVDEAKRNALDPALVAGLIRQESTWNPRALSPANARGLMQLLPSVGASIAATKRYPTWNVALLYEPDVSLELGTAHLASSLPRGTPITRALAAYNAGASRIPRWALRPGVADEQLFAEWIPFTETRDYVRIVQRNADVYRALYGLK